MGESAVPQSTVANQPALQWVSTFTVPPDGLASAISRSSGNPCAPMRRQVSASSSAIDAASAYAAAVRSPGGRLCSAARIRPTAQARFTAVGRVRPSMATAASRPAVEGSRRSASATP
jgi:hypothetical protein